MNRKLKQSLGLVSSLIMIGGAAAMATESPQTTPPPRLIFMQPLKGSSKRPKAPSLQQITCVYDGEVLHFDFVLPEGECALTLTGGSNTSCSFDSSELNAQVYIGGISDETELTLITEYGHQYSGTLEF